MYFEVNTLRVNSADSDRRMTTQGKRLQQARASAGFRSAREAAEKMEWTYSTYASHENDSRALRLHSARKYARAFGVSASWLMTGEDGKDMPSVSSVSQVKVLGDVAAGLWLEEDAAIADEDAYIPASPDPRFPADHQLALRVRGTSMNKIIQDGEYAIGVWLNKARPVQDGDLVAVRRHRAGLVETSLKRYRVMDGEPKLLPESTDSRHQKPLELDAEEEGTSVEIIALIIGGYRPFA